MISFDLPSAFRKQLADAVTISKTNGEFEIGTPFHYLDGDHPLFYIKYDGGVLQITDDGETLAHAAYRGVNLMDDRRRGRLESVARFYGVEHHDGALSLDIPSEDAVAAAFFRFAQACWDIDRLSREPPIRKSSKSNRVRSLLRTIVASAVQADGYIRDWHHPTRDPNRIYGANYMVEGKHRPILVFAAGTDMECLKASIASLHYRQAEFSCTSVAVSDPQHEVSNTSAVMLRDSVERQFSVDEDDEELTQFLRVEAKLPA